MPTSIPARFPLGETLITTSDDDNAKQAPLLAEANLRQVTIEQRISNRPPTHRALRDEILRLLNPDYAVREKMAKVDRQQR